MLQCQGDITRARWNLVVKINVSFCLLSLFKVWNFLATPQGQGIPLPGYARQTMSHQSHAA
jgi:hypothetical protein